MPAPENAAPHRLTDPHVSERLRRLLDTAATYLDGAVRDVQQGDPDHFFEHTWLLLCTIAACRAIALDPGTDSEEV